MSDINFQELGKRMMPVFHALVNSLYDKDFDLFLEHHPPAPKEEFDKAVSILAPLGKPIEVEYLSTIKKPNRLKVLCKVTYSDTAEELLWDFNLIPNDGEYRLVNMGFDK